MKKLEQSSNYAQNWYTRVFEVADDNFAIRLSKFKMADTIRLLKIRRKLRFF